MTRRERNGNTESSNPKIDLSPANWSAAGKQNSRLSKTWNKSMRASAKRIRRRSRPKSGKQFGRSPKTFQPCGMHRRRRLPIGNRIVRLLLERAVVNVREASACVHVTLQWAGGFTTQHEFIRPVLRYDQIADYARMVDRISELRDQGWSFVKIAEQAPIRRDFDRPNEPSSTTKCSANWCGSWSSSVPANA